MKPLTDVSEIESKAVIALSQLKASARVSSDAVSAQESVMFQSGYVMGYLAGQRAAFAEVRADLEKIV